MTAEVPGIAAARVADFFRTRVPDGDVPLAFTLISGGRSNLTYLVRGGARTWVLRRPPLGHVLPTAHDMAREFRILSALADTAVPVARPIALCRDADVNGAPFYVMEHRAGIVVHDELPAGFAEADADRARIGPALAGTLAKLHAVDWKAAGLADFGKPDGYLARQVERWGKQWEGNRTAPLPDVEEALRRLRAAVPVSPPATIVHGDFRLGNVALDPADPGRIVAVFDWEMATLGDPLADLGYLLMYWPQPGETQVAGIPHVTADHGFGPRETLVRVYAERSGRDVGAVDFYLVLAYTKLAVIAEGILKRALMGTDLTPDLSGMRVTAPLAARAVAVADASSDPRLRG
ncbi:MAG: phosphotransferase family protein [bacterium]|nr:phosphotransferase family protein [bacterium]